MERKIETLCKTANILIIGAALLASHAALAAKDDATGGLFSRIETVEEQHRLEGIDWRRVPLRTDARRPGPISSSPIRSRTVRVDLGRLARVRDQAAQGDAAPLNLNLFDDVELEAVIKRTASTRFGYSLSGRLKGQTHGSVTLVVSDGIVAGAIYSPIGNFVVASRGGAMHSVLEISGQHLSVSSRTLATCRRLRACCQRRPRQTCPTVTMGRSSICWCCIQKLPLRLRAG